MFSKKTMLLAVAVLLAWACNPQESEVATDPAFANDTDPDYAVIFPQDKVNTIEITVGATNWTALKIDMVAKGKGTFGAGGGQVVGGGGMGGGVPSFGEDAEYVPVSITFNGKIWKNVGYRPKGNSTLSSTWRAGIYKFPFRLKFDEFEDKYPEIKDQRFHGFKELSFSAGVKDNSLIREKVTGDIFRMAGIPAAQTAFYKVYVDFGDGKKYCGVYAAVEIIEDTMVKSQFNEKSGNIYKPESNFTAFTQAAFPKKNNETAADWSDVQGAITALNATNRTAEPAIWRANLEKYMNMEHFLKWLAVNTTLVNWDTYGAMAHNHYLYNHSTKKLMWIPWDNNEALTSNARVQTTLAGVANTWPLIKFVAEDPVYYAKYKVYMKEFNDNIFTTTKMNELFERNTNLITPFVNGDEKEIAPYSNLANTTSFTNALGILKQHVVNRNKAVTDFLK